MAGSRLEVARFGMYLFFPIGLMYYFGLPYYFEKYIKNTSLLPPKEELQKNKDLLEKYRIEREKRQTHDD